MYLYIRTGSTIVNCMRCRAEMLRSNIRFPYGKLFLLALLPICPFILQLLEMPTGEADSTRQSCLVLCYAGLCQASTTTIRGLMLTCDIYARIQTAYSMEQMVFRLFILLPVGTPCSHNADPCRFFPLSNCLNGQWPIYQSRQFIKEIPILAKSL